jgi:hypothetical protein
MTRGGWILGASAPVVLLYAALWYFRVFPTLRRVVGVIGVPLLAMLAMYTGFLLSGAWYVPLWSAEHLPLIFLNSGINCGIAAAGLVTLLAWPWLNLSGLESRPLIRWFGVFLLILMLVESWELYAFMRDLRNQGLLMGHEQAPTTDRFQYNVGTGGTLQPGTYVTIVTWNGYDTGVEEGMSPDTPIRIPAPNGQITIVTPRRLGVTYNVYLGPSHSEARQVAANLAPRESVTIREISPGGLSPPLNIQTGGRFVAPSGGELAYRYLTGGPQYPWALFGGTAEAASTEVVGIPPTPVVFHSPPHGRTLFPWFWWGVVGFALALPLALTIVEFASDLVNRTVANGVAAVKFASVLIGGVILRFVIVWGGDLKAPLVFPSNWPIPLPPPGLGG